MDFSPADTKRKNMKQTISGAAVILAIIAIVGLSPAAAQNTPVATIYISPTEALSINEGESGSFTIRFGVGSGDISEDAIVRLSSDNSLFSLSPTSLTFTSTNYYRPQTVTVTVAHDDDTLDFTDSVTITTSGGFTAPVTTKTINVDDDEPPAGTIVLSPAESLSINEGASKDFTVRLSARPEGTAILTLSKNEDDISLSPTTLAFTESSWNKTQSVTVSVAYDDDNLDLSDTVTLVASGGITASDATITINVSDDVPAGNIVLSPAGTLVIDEGGTRSFTVRFDTRPDANIIVSLSKTGDAISFSPSRLIFTTSNYDRAQSVTVSAGQDQDARNESGIITLSAAGGIDASNATKAIAVNDDEAAFSGNVVFSPEGTLTVEEGDRATITIKLSEAPTENVRVQVFGDFNILLDAGTNIFTPSNWNTPQSLSFRASDDAFATYQTGPFKATISNIRTDVTIREQTTSNLTLVITDNDSPVLTGAIVISPADTLELDEGESGSFTVKLSRQPKVQAVVSLVSDDAAVSLSPQSLTFTHLNWRTEQSVSVDAVQDGDSLDDDATITLSASASGIIAPNVTKRVTVSDDDTAFTGNVVFSPEGTLTVEEGDRATITIKLSEAPGEDVRVQVLGDFNILLDVGTNIFTPSNWNTPQSVSFRASDDAFATYQTGPFKATIYNIRRGVTIREQTTSNLTLVITDSDSPVLTGAIVLSPAGTLELDEGESGSFSVKLSRQPKVQAVVSLVSDDAAVSLRPESLTFTHLNWRTEQSVTVNAVQDSDSLDADATLTLSASASGIIAPNITKRVTVSDDDTAFTGNVVFSPEGTLTVEEGDRATITIKLSEAPGENVRVQVDGSVGITFDAGTNIFTPSNWNTPQSISFGANEDPLVTYQTGQFNANIFNVRTSTLIKRQNSSNTTLIIQDSDAPIPTGTIVLSSADTLSLDEGESGSFTVKLSRQPKTQTIVSLTSDDTGISLSPRSLTFTLLGWETEQSVTVDTVQDSDSMDETATITLSASASGISAPDVTKRVAVSDDDTAFSGTVIFSPDGDFVVEEGARASVGVKLSEAPKENVRVQIFGNFNILLDAGTNIFTPSNWNTPQSVSFRALEDPFSTYQASQFNADIFNLRTSALIKRQNSSNTTLIIQDSDATAPTGTIVLSPTQALSLDEGESGSFTAKLSAQPIRDVTITVSNDDPAAVSVSPERLVFTRLGWRTEQRITVRAVHDSDTDHEVATLVLSASAGIDAPDAGKTVNVNDDDQATTPVGSIVLSPATALEITEGETGILGVRLSVMPQGNVVVSLSKTHDDISLSPSSLAFTRSSWNRMQSVSVDVAHDDDLSDFSDTIVLSATGGINALETTKTVDVSDDDSPVGTIVLSPTETLVIDEGESGEFTVRLSVKPNADVTIDLSKSRDDISLSRTRLSFTESDWSDAQTITVSAEHDDDHLSFTDTIVLSASGGIEAPDATKAIEVIDDEPPAGTITLSPAGTLVIDEGGSKSFSVRLGSRPQIDVIVALSKTDADISLVPARLTFTASDWNRPQSITVRADHDDDASSEADIITLSASGGLVATATKTVNIVDDDSPTGDIILSPAGDLAVDEGGTASFSVRLGTRPQIDVIVALSKTDADISLTPARLTFTASDWNRPQSITVRADHDDDASNEADIITLSASGGLVATATKTVDIADDDPPTGDIILSPAGDLAIDEGGSASFSVRLGTRPAGNVTVTLSKTVDDVSLSPTRLTFTESDWDAPQDVTVSAGQDDDTENETDTITLVASGGFVARATKRVNISDGDTLIPAIVLSPAGILTIDEGESGEFSVRLGTRPAKSVTVALSKTVDDVSLSPTRLTFTESDWNRQQSVSVRADFDDDTTNGNDTITLVASGAEGYEGLSASISLTVIDSPGELVLSADRIDVMEGQAPVSFSVRLDTKPVNTDIVFVSLSRTNADITLSPSSLIFTMNNWSEAQSVAIEAADDAGREDERDIITLTAAGGNYDRTTGEIMVAIFDDDDDGPEGGIPEQAKAYILAIPPDTADDASELRIRCHQESPCTVYLDCSAQTDGSTFKGWVPGPIPARGGRALTATDIVRHTGGSWSGKGRLGCALRSDHTIGAQIWTYSGDGVLVNNSAMIRSAPENEVHRADIESIPSPTESEVSNIRIRCIAPADTHCTDTNFSCFDDSGYRYKGNLGIVERLTTRHLKADELADIIGHRWSGIRLSCEIRSNQAFTAQLLTRTGGGGALVNNSASNEVSPRPSNSEFPRPGIF